jgi:hypothetical protein
MKRYKHNLSHTHLLTCEMGQLVPINVTEVLPGDTVQQQSNVLIRVSPLAAPVFHPVTARVHHFFVPNRLVWDGWEDFITGGPNGDDASSPPTIPSTATEADLMDHMGIAQVADIPVSALPIRAYNLIFNEFFRDQDLKTEIGADNTATLNVAWEKDYFTTARPWTQKGPNITVPLGEQAPIVGLGKATDAFNQGPIDVIETGGASVEYENASLFNGAGGPTTPESWYAKGSGATGNPEIFADLSNVLGANVNEFRRAFALQRYQEARARYGSRYTEYLRYLGVNPTDQRLQRPEFLGGGRTQINFSEVLQTAPEQTGQPSTTEFGVGDLYGHGIGAMRSNKYRRFIEEHGYILSLLSVRPKTMYTQGIPRHFLREYKEDYFQRELQHIGQQEILNNEIYADPTNGSEVFGYQDRYAEYRQQFSHVSGEMRSTLDYWHMGRDFGVPPVLNNDFIRCTPTKRIHNEQTQHALWVMVQNNIVARRLVGKNAAGRII